MVSHEGRDIGVGERVAIGNQKRRIVEQRKRQSRSSGGAKDRSFPRIANANAEILPVADDACDGVRKVVEIEDCVRHARGSQLRQNPPDERLTRHRKCGLGTDE